MSLIIRDVYDREVDRLSKMSPSQLQAIWNTANSPLFDFLSVSRENDSERCGCPSIIAKTKLGETECRFGMQNWADKYDLAPQMQALNLPPAGSDFDASQLPKFAEAQRIADKVIPGRLPPEAVDNHDLRECLEEEQLGKDEELSI